MVSPGALSFYTDGEICRKYAVSYQLYDDDTQIYGSFKVDDSVDGKIALTKIEKCIAEICACMVIQRLKLNDEKTSMSTLCHHSYVHYTVLKK